MLWISAAKVLFVLLGFAVQFGLPRVLGTPGEFGLLSAAIAFTVILTNAMTASMVQTTSKLVAEGGPGIVRTLATRHAAIGVTLGLVLVSAADVIGGRLLSSPSLVPLVRLASIVVVSYAVYSTAIGALNGAHAFDRQARLDATFSTVRTLGLLGGGLAMGAALSAMAGFATAAALMAVIGAVAARLHQAPTGRVPEASEHLRILLPILLYQLGLNALLQLDLELLVAGATLEAVAQGANASEAADVATHEAGLYRAAQTLAFVPYQLMTSVTLVLFPIVAKASSAGDDAGARDAVSGALRFSLLFVVGLLAPLAGASAGAIAVAFPATYADAATVVPALAASQAAFALGVVAATVLVSRGRAWLAVGLALAAVVVGVSGDVAAWWLAPGALRVGTALGTMLGSVTFAIGTTAALQRELGAHVKALTWGRVAVAGGVAVAVGRAIAAEGRVAGLLALIAAGLAYLAVLAITRELGAADLATIQRIVGRRGR